MAVNPMMESVFNAGVNGMNSAIRGVKQAAQEVAELNETGSAEDASRTYADIEDVTDAITRLKLYERQVQASAKVVETADEVLGFLLDVRA